MSGGFVTRNEIVLVGRVGHVSGSAMKDLVLGANITGDPAV
ncbi:MAG TPA: hypothetical protein VNG13_01285 [Mycobacteriales bacterium]|nr:hypothetical protein [Mycobacteriales bacterium]